MTQAVAPRVIAVVVTFNRLTLLQTLLTRLREIDALAAILVVDNASTDGTPAWLAEQSDISTELLTTNTGGAGGFHRGLLGAIDAGADLVWLMDDDGLPEPDCLDLLLQHRDRLDFWGPVVVDEQEPDRLVFPIRLPGGARTVRHLADVRAAADAGGVIKDVVIPFNGVLVTKELVARIGSVREEFFIWGDDHEYRLRAVQAGARTGTVVAAAVAHPNVGELGTPMAFGLTTYNHSPSDLKHYCMARNNLLNLKEYGGPLQAGAFAAKTLWFYTITRPNLSRLKLSARAMYDGLRGDFTGHRRFLA